MSDLDALWSSLKPDNAGLVAAVVQHARTGVVLMVGYMNRQALDATLEARQVTFWSRSRDCLWRKGETSGHTLDLADVRVDCDGDALLVMAHPNGPTCHTGRTSCFFTPLDGLDRAPPDDGPSPRPDATLAQVFATILERKAGRGTTNPEGKSYVRSLLEKGTPKINAKIEEEASELAAALSGESDERVASEAADLIFHALVGLASRDVDLQAVAKVFEARFGTSGIDEKASRTPR